MDLRPLLLHLYLGMESRGCRAVCPSQQYLHHGCSGLPSTAAPSPTSPHFHLTLTLGFIQRSLACLQDCLSSLLLCSKLPQTAWLGIICFFFTSYFLWTRSLGLAQPGVLLGPQSRYWTGCILVGGSKRQRTASKLPQAVGRTHLLVVVELKVACFFRGQQESL